MTKLRIAVIPGEFDQYVNLRPVRLFDGVPAERIWARPSALPSPVNAPSTGKAYR
jgi:hypothetical protein